MSADLSPTDDAGPSPEATRLIDAFAKCVTRYMQLNENHGMDAARTALESYVRELEQRRDTYRDNYILAINDAEDRMAERAALRTALQACEEVLRLVHGATGQVLKNAPMPKHSTFEAWTMAATALGLIGGPAKHE